MNFSPFKSPLKFYVITLATDWAGRMVKAGAGMVQPCYKTLHGDELKREIECCVATRQDSITQFLTDDHWHEAIEIGAYGVYLGQKDMDTADLAAIEAAGLRLGLSVRFVVELGRVLSTHPSYVVSGVTFPITTKRVSTAPQGSDKLREYVRQAHGTPVVATGDIDLNNAEDVLATGVSSLAVARAVTEAESPETVVKVFQALWNQ